MGRWKAHGRLPISANWTFFASSHGWGQGRIKTNIGPDAAAQQMAYFVKGNMNQDHYKTMNGSNAAAPTAPTLIGTGWGTMSRYWSKWRCLKGGVGHFKHKFQGEGGRTPTNFGVRKLESLGYHAVLFAWSYV